MSQDEELIERHVADLRLQAEGRRAMSPVLMNSDGASAVRGEADRLDHLADRLEALAQPVVGEADPHPGFVPCPTCRQYSHSLGEGRLTEAYMHFQSMFSHRGDGIPTQDSFDAKTRDAAQVLMTAALAASPSPVVGDEGRRERITQPVVDAALDVEWAVDGGGDAPSRGQEYTMRDVLEAYGDGHFSTLEIENAMHTAISAALNPPVGNPWAVEYDREGPR